MSDGRTDRGSYECSRGLDSRTSIAERGKTMILEGCLGGKEAE